MGPEFFQTEQGRKFYNSQLPELIKALNRIAEAVEKSNELRLSEDSRNLSKSKDT